VKEASDRIFKERTKNSEVARVFQPVLFCWKHEGREGHEGVARRLRALRFVHVELNRMHGLETRATLDM
jgi:hypothetical protein